MSIKSNFSHNLLGQSLITMRKNTVKLSIIWVLLLVILASLLPGDVMARPQSSIADGFDWPVGKPNGDGWGLYGGYAYLVWAYVGNGNYEWHPGVDLNWGYHNDVGQPVYAIANGVVAEAHPSYTWYIMLEHTLPDGTKVWSNYKHINRASGLPVGTVVQKGQQIGTIDNSAHLHFELRTQPPNPSQGYAGYLWVVGKTKEWVQARFTDPISFIESHRNITPPPPPPPATEVTIDNGDPGFYSTGGWIAASNWTDCQGYGGDAVWTYSRRPGYSNDVDYATWTPNLAQAGSYTVFVHIPRFYNGLADTRHARYKIYYNGGMQEVEISQEGNWCSWISLGTYNFSAGTSGYVYLGDYTGGENPQRGVIADAVKFVLAAAPPPSTTLVDDGGSGFSSSAGWTTATSGWTRGCAGNDGDARWTWSRRPYYTDDVDWAKWTPNLPQSGNYEVYFFVPGINNGLPDTQHARYRIHHANGETVVEYSQRDHWCGWVSLGTFYFNAGAAGWVYLGDFTGESPQTSVVADAIKWVYRDSAPSPSPTPTPTPPPPPQTDIVSAARAEIGMPYNANRQPFCGAWGPWQTVYGVCSDVAVDAYLRGTGGQAAPQSCGVSTWAAMTQSQGGLNLVKAIWEDGKAHPGRYQYNSGRWAEDQRRYFGYNQVLLTCDQPWQPGDAVWFDWNGDNRADHAGVITVVDGSGRPTRMVHAPGCRNCSCKNYLACETDWTSNYQAACVGHGRIGTVAAGNVQAVTGSTRYLAIGLQAASSAAADIALYAPDGTRVERVFDEATLSFNNSDYVPYTPRQDYSSDADLQWLYLHNPAPGTYRIQMNGREVTPFELIVQTNVSGTVVSDQHFSGNLAAGQTLLSNLTISESQGQLIAQATNPSSGAILEIAGMTGAQEILFEVIETSGVSGAGMVQLVPSDLTSPDGQRIPASAITLEPASFELLAGGAQGVTLQVHWPAQPGTPYLGNVTIKSSSGGSLRLPIEFQTQNEPQRIFLPLIIRRR